MAKKKIEGSDDLIIERKKKLLDLDLQYNEKKHKLKMKELEFIRENDRLHHERELERGRIKSAEIRKTLMRKQDPFKF